jgi:dTDP-4-amino-4,6-dideoxygalactose transaminase
VAELSRSCQDAGIKLIFDSAQAAGTRTTTGRVGGNGLAEVFSFHATKILSSAEGGCVTTDDDDLAERLRNIRSSYGAPRHVAVRGTLNGRFSEAQAALLLHSLDDFERRVATNREVLSVYRSLLASVPGLEMYEPSPGVIANASYAVVSVDEARFGLSRDAVITVLRADNVLARNYFSPGLHRTEPYARSAPAGRELPVTEMLCERLLQLPVGAQCGPREAARVTELLYEAHEHASALAQLTSSTKARREDRSEQCVLA